MPPRGLVAGTWEMAVGDGLLDLAAVYKKGQGRPDSLTLPLPPFSLSVKGQKEAGPGGHWEAYSP